MSSAVWYWKKPFCTLSSLITTLNGRPESMGFDSVFSGGESACTRLRFPSRSVFKYIRGASKNKLLTHNSPLSSRFQDIRRKRRFNSTNLSFVGALSSTLCNSTSPLQSERRLPDQIIVPGMA